MQLKAGGILRRDFCTVEGPIYTNEIRQGANRKASDVERLLHASKMAIQSI